MKKSILVFCFVVLASRQGTAQTLSATINRNPIPTGEQFQVTYSLNANGSNFQAPPFKDFSVLSGPNQSTSMSFVNGSASQSISYTYILAGNKEGKFTVPGASIDCNGKRIQSNPLVIEIVKGNPQQNKAQSGNTQQGGDDVQAQLSKSILIKAFANKTSPFLGEAVTVTYKLYTKVSIVNSSITKMPSFNGFWSQDIELPKQAQFHQEVLNGVSYNAAEIKKMVLYPQRSGALELDPMGGEFIARVQVKRGRSNDPFAQFFNDPFFGMGAQDVKVEAKSDPLKINVKELPGIAPDGYSGAVGKFSMEAFIDKPETKTNEAVNLKIKITGSGNIKLIDAPKPTFPPDIETYDPKTNDNISVTANGVSGSRTYEFLLVPRHAGEYKIEPFRFSYFDLEKKSYVTVSSKEFLLKVAKGSETETAATVTGVSKEDLQLLGKDIRYIKTGKVKWIRKGENFFGSALFFGNLFSPAVLFFVFLLVYRRNQEMQGNIQLMKSRKATKIARKRLSSAKECMTKNEREKFYDEVFKALWGYLGDKLGIPVSGLSKESAKESLLSKGMSEEKIDKFIGTIDRCEFARFAPGGAGEMKAMYEETIELVSTMEQELKSYKA